jgi:hypothetical protein
MRMCALYDDASIEGDSGLVPTLDRLAQVFRCLDPEACSDKTAVPVATVKLMQMLWPMFETILDRYRVYYHILICSHLIYSFDR